MQDEIEADTPGAVRISGVNLIAAEAGVAEMCMGRDLPLLQDVFEVGAWVLWDVEYRDVVILDAENKPYAVYNLTIHDLANPDNYAELKQILETAAAGG